MDPLDPAYVWTNVYDYYLYRMATYLKDTEMASGIKNGTRMAGARSFKIKGWPQNPTPEFRAYQQRAMYRGNLLKFVNPYYDPSDRSFDLSNDARNMRIILLCSTINRELFFAVKDPYFGIGEDFNNTQDDTMNSSNQFNGQNKIGNILTIIRKQLFTSTRPEINTFLENDAKEPVRSNAYLQLAFWRDLK
jgi:hypothetical protein